MIFVKYAHTTEEANILGQNAKRQQKRQIVLFISAVTLDV